MALRRSGVRSPSAPPAFAASQLRLASQPRSGWKEGGRSELTAIGDDPGLPPVRLHSRRRRAQCGIADAMLEADPIDAFAAPPGVPVAELDAPRRRVFLANKLERPLPRIVLAIHAARFPSANETDVEEYRIVERRGGTGSRIAARSRKDRDESRGGERPPHCI